MEPYEQEEYKKEISWLNIDLAKYWLDNVSDKFSANPTLGNLNWTILFYSLYVIVFLFIGTRILKRKEIK